jgi:hypothetical protein
MAQSLAASDMGSGGVRARAISIHKKTRGQTMRKALWAILLVATLLTALPSRAQNPNYDVGPVGRATYFHLKPGQGQAFWKDFREDLKPIYDAVKKEGMITD